MWKRTFIAAVALTLSGLASAASLGSADLPEGANWYLHVNLELMRTSPVGQRILAETLDEAFEDVERELGVSLSDQIQALTVFGGNLPPNSGAVIAHGALRPQTRDQLVSEMTKAGTFLEAEHAGMRYFGIDDLRGHSYEDGEIKQADVSFGHDDDLVYVAFGSDQTLFTSNLETVQRFLEAGGYLAGLGGDPGALMVIEADRAMVQGGMNAQSGHAEHWDSSILSNVERVAAVLLDEPGGLGVHADILALSPQIAESVSNIVQGLVALKALEASDEPMIGELLKSTRIETDGAAITIDAFIGADLLDEILR